MSDGKDQGFDARELGYKVELWVYDLSHGMARAMSAQILGKQIDLIPHTGVVVYGSEYYYGGGIQAAYPGTTAAGTPVEKITLGVTSIPQKIFHEYLRGVSNKYTPQTYNLITNNCNNFSDDVAKFLLDKTIPTHITGLPQEAMSTPLGQMMRPMLESMQHQMGGAVPWGSAPLNLPPINNNAQMEEIPEGQASKDIEDAKKEIEKAKSNANSTSVTTTNGCYPDLKSNGTTSSHQPTSPPTLHHHQTLHLKTLKMEAKMFLQKDPDYSKFVALVKTYNKKIQTKAASAALTPEVITALDKIKADLGNPSVSIPESLEGALYDAIASWPAKLLFPVLCVYQAVLLRPEGRARLATKFGKLLPKLLALLDESAKAPTQMATLCLFCNLLHESSMCHTLIHHEDFLEAVVSAIESKSDLVRFPAARVALNLAIAFPKDGGADGVMMLGSILPTAVLEEKNYDIAYFMTLALGQLVFCNDDAVEVVSAMDFRAAPVAASFAKHKKKAKLTTLAHEVDLLLEAGGEIEELD
mmetsp:Transcript_10708/g.21136  ORF Transcript_10708/g.21136 Transcript_10708/m.21136 type:complete len:527 (-) Transcript_10708:314-1894(-)